MRFRWRLQVFSLPLLLVSILLNSNVAAQNTPANLPKLPGPGAAASTTAAAATTKAAATSKGTETTSQPTAKATATTSAPSSDTAGLNGLPKLAQDNYPAPTVPPTANAPFMHKSNLPDGTVFIAVGAALGFFGFLVLAWRGLVAWSLHRSVKRAAMAQSAKYAPFGDSRKHLGKTKGPYSNLGPGSTLSLDQLGGVGKGGPTSQSARGNLFFSPTAGAAMTPASRGSSYLPAGYYAAGSSAPGSGSGMMHIGGGGIGLSNLRPESHRYSRARSTGPSPPDSPSLPPTRGGDSTYHGRLSTAALTTHASNSSLNVSTTAAVAQSRAPSAYLEDLFSNHAPETPPPEEHGRGRNRY